MFAQVKEVKSVTSKRPLSIIAEHDGNVAEFKTDSNCQQTISNISKDSGFQPGDLKTDVKNEFTKPLGSDSKRSPKMTKGKRRSAPKQSASPSKSRQNFQKQTVSAANSEKPLRNPSLAKHTAESKVEVLECSAGMLPSSNEDEGCNGANIERQMNGAVPTRASCSDSTHAHEHLGLETDSAFTGLISNEESISRVDSQTISPVVPDICQNNVEETKEAPHPARLPLSSPASQCVTPGIESGSGSWTQAAELNNIQDMDNSVEQNIPQITITSVEDSQCQSSISPDSDNDTICKFSSLVHSSSSSSIFSQSSTNRTCNYASGKRPKLVAHLSKIKNVESSGSVCERSDGNRGASPNPELSVHLSDFWRLKETTEKLHLSTRRPSTMLWREQFMEGQGLPGVDCGQSENVTDENLTTDRKQRIDAALEWLRNELQEMRCQDQNLARQLLAIRQDIHQLKLQRSTEEHQELIEDFQSELDDIQEFSDVLDLPHSVYGNNPLKHVGVTRLNISARRFSAC